MGCQATHSPNCGGEGAINVMGYHDAREIPNYWSLAENFVLQDHMFEPNSSWSLPQHLFMVSEWSAICRQGRRPDELHQRVRPARVPARLRARTAPFPAGLCLDRPDLPALHEAGMSWKYYVQSGSQPDCANDEDNCPPVSQNARTPGIWNPLPYFDTVKQDGQLGNITDVTNFYKDGTGGTIAGRQLDHAQPAKRRTSPGAFKHRSGVDGEPDQCGGARPRLEQHGDLPLMGRLGRFLRSRRAAGGGPEWIWSARARTRDQPVCQERFHRPPGTEP